MKTTVQPLVQSDGPYGAEATAARESAQAQAVVLLILEGSRGSALTIQASDAIKRALPGLLRQIADNLEAGAPAAAGAEP